MDFADIRDCRDLTIQSIIDHYALNQPEKVFAVFPDENSQITWAELQETARQLAQYLLNQGLTPGSRVGMLRGNGRAALELFLGVMYSGYTVATFNPVAGDSALRYVFSHSMIQIVFVDDENDDAFASSREDEVLLNLREEREPPPPPKPIPVTPLEQEDESVVKLIVVVIIVARDSFERREKEYTFSIRSNICERFLSKKKGRSRLCCARAVQREKKRKKRKIPPPEIFFLSTHVSLL